MTNTSPSKHIGKIALASAALATALYLLMITVTLAHLQSISGHTPFDMRPLGYTVKDATTLLTSLQAEGRSYYLTRQLPLDALYPAFMAATLIATLCWFAQRLQSRALIRLGITLSLAGALFDYIENLGILAMLWRWPEVSPLLVQAASLATITKSALTTLAVLLLIFIAILWSRSPKPNQAAPFERA